MKASTATVSVEFDGQVVTITRSVLSGQGRGSKTIHLSQIGAVQLRAPSVTAIQGDGVWSVSVMGEVQSSDSRRGRGAARKDARGDENSVVIGRGHVKAFQALTDEINAAKAGVGQQAAPAPTPAAPAPNLDREGVIAQLRQLGRMHHEGQVSDEVFIGQMHQLLPRL